MTKEELLEEMLSLLIKIQATGKYLLSEELQEEIKNMINKIGGNK